jgi:hopanoid biosynthesis associated radical SAM protein HpnH
MKAASLEIGLRLARLVWKNRRRKRELFPMVTMLEPLEACNLACKGCGRIREYHESVILKKKMVSVEKCLEVVDEADSPVVSIAGGEPLMHPEIDQIVEGILAQKRFVYLCTNGLLLERSMSKIKPNRRFCWVVHLDGTEQIHDYWVDRKGTWQKAMRAINRALGEGYRVCTNTTIFKNSDVEDLHRLFENLTELGVEGLMISSGFAYESLVDLDFFLERELSKQTYQRLLNTGRRFPYYNNPLYLEFLKGNRDYPCRAWASPTYTPEGWRKPCYLIADEHTLSLDELMKPSLWQRYGMGKDPRCASCIMHSGYEPGIVKEMFSDASEFKDLITLFLKQSKNGRLKAAN